MPRRSARNSVTSCCRCSSTPGSPRRRPPTQGGFDIDDVAGDLVDKLVRRHPHVFEADAAPVRTRCRSAAALGRAEEGRARPVRGARRGRSRPAGDGVGRRSSGHAPRSSACEWTRRPGIRRRSAVPHRLRRRRARRGPGVRAAGRGHRARRTRWRPPKRRPAEQCLSSAGSVDVAPSEPGDARPDQRRRRSA